MSEAPERICTCDSLPEPPDDNCPAHGLEKPNKVWLRRDETWDWAFLLHSPVEGDVEYIRKAALPVEEIRAEMERQRGLTYQGAHSLLSRILAVLEGNDEQRK